MERRTLILGGGRFALAGLGAASLLGESTVPVAAARSFDWKGTDFLSGGTARISASLPEPLFRSAPNCTVTCAQTRGPCFAKAPVRTDISEGRLGLPTRVSLRLVDAETCNPVEGAVIDIWHCSADGVYSGEAASMCNAATRKRKPRCSAGAPRSRMPAAGLTSSLSIPAGILAALCISICACSTETARRWSRS